MSKLIQHVGSLATLLQLCRIQQQLLLALRLLLHLLMPIYQPTLDLKLQLGLTFMISTMAYLTSKTTRSISPFLTRFIAIGPPILPKPMNPTLPEADRIDEKQRNIFLKLIIIFQYIL